LHAAIGESLAAAEQHVTQAALLMEAHGEKLKVQAEELKKEQRQLDTLKAAQG
jgi:hypothetical protein